MNLISRMFRRPRAVRLEEVSGQSDQQRLMMNDLLRSKIAASHPVIRESFVPGKDVAVAIPYCRKDLGAVLDLLTWIQQLQAGDRFGRLILCHPAGLDAEIAEFVAAQAQLGFQRVDSIGTAFDLPREGWPTGTVWSFLHIAEFARKNRIDFWLNEPDCIPLRAGWFKDLVREYRDCGLPYMGYIEPAHPGGHYPRHMTGNGFYNWDTFQFIRAERMDTAWDIGMAEYLTPRCHPSRLFHQEFGPLDHPPTFHSRESVSRIPREAAVFHRNKDGSLIQQLRGGAR